MIAVAERINGMFKDVKKAIRKKDPAPVIDLAHRQTEAGAKYLDINVGTAAEDQKAAMRWLVETVQGAVKTSAATPTNSTPTSRWPSNTTPHSSPSP